MGDVRANMLNPAFGMVKGYYDLFYDEAATDFDRFDLATGAKIFSTAPPSVSIKAVVGGVQLSVIGAYGRQVVVENSEDGKTWSSLLPALQGTGGLTLPSQVYPIVGNSKFFRVRAVGSGSSQQLIKATTSP